MPVSNPRFPHICRIIRKTVKNPLIDEDDFTSLDESVPGVKVIHFSDDYSDDFGVSAAGNLSFSDDFNDDFGRDQTFKVIYEGKCRCYEKHTTSDRGEVITSYRGLALPFTQDDWERLGIVPCEGDEIAVDRGAFREYGRVVDKNPANFHGTHLTWRYGRN